jgi:DNA-binding NtrC family response regulator
MPSTKVLLVDDEVDFVETLAERLRSRGMEVEVATSGAQAVDKVDERSFDAVVLDLAMPGMDGIATLKKLLAKNPDLQVMLLTGQATVKSAVEATNLGALDVLEKPTDIDTLMEKIGHAQSKTEALGEKRVQEMIEKVLLTRGV